MKKSEVNVFIVEDDHSVRASIGEAVKRAGYKSILLAKPADAIAEMKLRPIHAAIIDCMLPGKNGIELARVIRKEAGEQIPIILCSGVFRDKAFASDARKKTGAIDFLYKPIDLKVLVENLDVELAMVVDAPKVALHSLLSKARSSSRERRRALDHIEEGVGFDLPMILSILMDADSTGHLNIVAAEGELYGITLVKGKVTKVDSNPNMNSSDMVVQKHGLATAEEVATIKGTGFKGDLLQYLLKESLISPHVLPVLRIEQIFLDLRKLITEDSIQINFSPDRKLKEAVVGVDIASFTPLIHETIENGLSLDWLKRFYSDWMDHPVRHGGEFNKDHLVFSMPIITRLKGLKDVLLKEPTIEEVLLEEAYSEESLLKAIHLLAVRRLIVFDEDRRTSNLNEKMSRLKLMAESLKGKNAVQVFEFFGAEAPLRAYEVERIYKEFAKLNHPDKLPAEAPEELRKLNNEVFGLVSFAHDTVSNEENFSRFKSKEKQKSAKAQLDAEVIVEQGLKALRMGKYSEALQEFESAYERFEENNTLLYVLWAKFKVNAEQMDEAELNACVEKLNKYKVEDRRTALYNFVQGLSRKELKDIGGAAASFQKALQFNPNFLDARRELVALKGTPKKTMSASDLLTGDLSEVVSQLFKRKKS